MRASDASIVLLLTALTAIPAEGQRVTPTALVSKPAVESPFGSLPRADSGAAARLGVGERILWGSMGAAGGMLLGGVLGYGIGKGFARHDGVGEDYSGLLEAAVGAGLGSLFGGAAGAAAPALGSSCSSEARFGWALLGSIAGAMGGLVASANGDLFLYPIGVGIGAGVAAHRCGRRA